MISYPDKTKQQKALKKSQRKSAKIKVRGDLNKMCHCTKNEVFLNISSVNVTKSAEDCRGLLFSI